MEHEPNLELLRRARETIVGLFYGYPPVDREITRNLIALMDAVIACQKGGKPSPSIRIKALEGCLRELISAAASVMDEVGDMPSDPAECYESWGLLCATLTDAVGLLPLPSDPRSGPDGPVADSDEGYKILPGEEDWNQPQEE